MSAQFPNAIVSPRTIANRSGVVYDANDQKTFYAEDLNSVNDEVVAIENALGVNFKNIDYLGWKQLLTIPTLQSSDAPNYVLRFAADMTAFLAVGQRIKLTQNSAIKYFIVVAVGAYSGGNTDVTIYGGTDYTMESTATYAVTVPFFSMQKAPFGFPLNPEKWTIEVVHTSERVQASPTQDTWYNLGSISISIPIGSWRVNYQCSLYVAGGTTPATLSSLSTSNNSRSDADFDCMGLGDTGGICTSRFREKFLSLSSKVSYYLIEKVTNTSASTLRLNVSAGSDQDKTIIRAQCAYL